MYSIPSNPDLNGVIGSPLVQICFGEHDLQFHFDSGAWIGSQSSVEHSEGGVLLTSWGENGIVGAAFQSLLGKAANAFAVPNEKKLELHFENGQILALLDDSEQFESFQVYQQGKTMPSLVV